MKIRFTADYAPERGVPAHSGDVATLPDDMAREHLAAGRAVQLDETTGAPIGPTPPPSDNERPSEAGEQSASSATPEKPAPKRRTAPKKS